MSEITLPTNEERTFVCCLCSLNLEYYDEWKDTPIVEDLVRFLDNVLQFFIENADEKYLGKAIYSAKKERALGLGAMGWHYYLQRNNIPFEGGGIGSSAQMNNIIFKDIKEKAVEASKTLAKERGEPEDMVGTGMRNSALLAIAPTSNNSTILKTSPSIEPVYKNIFTQTTRSGSFLVKNKYLQLLLEKKGYSEEEMEVFWSLCLKSNGSVFGDWNTYLTDEEKNIFKGAFEIDQHWVVEQADQRARYICQAQSTNLFFPSGTDRAYMNSVHMKFLKSEYAKSLYYYRTEKEAKVDKVKEIQRKSLQDWSDEGCPSCEG